MRHCGKGKVGREGEGAGDGEHPKAAGRQTRYPTTAHALSLCTYVVALGVLQVLLVLDDPPRGGHALGEAAEDFHAEAERRALLLPTAPAAGHVPGAAQVPRHVPVEGALAELVGGAPGAPEGVAAVAGRGARSREHLSLPVLHILLLPHLARGVTGLLIRHLGRLV